MTKIVATRGWQDQVDIDSAGTSGYHSGRPADARMTEALTARGYSCLSKSRPVDPTVDFDDFDKIVAMDDSNYNDLLNLAEVYGKPAHHVVKMCDSRNLLTATEVPDPYYGGAKGFDNVIDILEDALEPFADQLADSLPQPFQPDSTS